ncbi:bacteriocin [Companilactobacillus farciminis]|nr:bacteriocin [Companilactobacillus farciminis]
MRKNISEEKLSKISGGKTRNLTMAYQSKGFVKKIISWIKHK